MATNQEELDYIYGAWVPGVKGQQVAGELYARLLNIETIVSALPKTTANVTLTDAQVTALANQIAAKLPAAPSADQIAAAVAKALAAKLGA
ncbi:hypothetical protein SCMU_13720 [Sinomonas cyclohexanicum]|uniref:Uncharacterized protein n=1 Tax=Sinomonas cyclohexanicum TaxID=322009 RepID=A0ABM7PTF9_SINCY|nr:hypothetical protein [Corynebacterium cyclohexanicum]BCT75530.1 hypothetical protein SCMU_13720 [Corynebacterium cyclohexanicum]